MEKDDAFAKEERKLQSQKLTCLLPIETHKPNKTHAQKPVAQLQQNINSI